MRRFDVDNVVIFYPFEYVRLFSHAWDLVLIEGWFPAIDDFIQMIRINNRNVVVLFYCLDPVYPAPNVVAALAIDGLLTNSDVVYSRFQSYIPVRKILLAADPLQMKPDLSMSRDYGAVYVGAGGGMVSYKYLLLDMLVESIPRGLLLYGSHWDEIPILADTWKGTLPRSDIPRAYSSASVILASTTDQQREASMINNRIFEALSCGGVVVSEPSDAIKAIFNDHVIFVSDGAAARNIIDQVVNGVGRNWTEFRLGARREIIQKHTWDHRTVEILDFFNSLKLQNFLKGDRPYNSRNVNVGSNFHSNSFEFSRFPMMAWVCSNSVSRLHDYLISSAYIVRILETQYKVVIFSEAEWHLLMISQTKSGDDHLVSKFDVIIAIVKINDSLDKIFQMLELGIEVQSKNHVQKRIGYIFGIEQIETFNESKTKIDYYDVLWYRDSYDIMAIEANNFSVLENRLQHVFGVDVSDISPTSAALGIRVQMGTEMDNEQNLNIGQYPKNISNLVICFFEQINLCTSEVIRSLTGSLPHSFLLVGGTWLEWSNHSGLFKMSDFDSSTEETTALMQQISRTVHLSDESIAYGCKLISLADRLYVIHDQDRGTNDQIWHFVSAFAGETSIVLLKQNDRLKTLIKNGFQTWDIKNLEVEVLRGIARVHGMNQVNSRFSMPDFINGSVVTSLRTLIPISVSKFILGRDGQLCLQRDGVNIFCAIRLANDYIELELNFTYEDLTKYHNTKLHVKSCIDSSACEINEIDQRSTCPSYNIRYHFDLKEIIIQVLLRGTIFGESTQVETISIFVPARNSCLCDGNIVKKDDKISQTGKLRALLNVFM